MWPFDNLLGLVEPPQHERVHKPSPIKIPDSADLVLGPSIWLEFISWRRNPRAGAIVYHPDKDFPNVLCECHLLFNFRAIRKFFPGKEYWRVDSWDPLTLHPSVHCSYKTGGCGWHGFIVKGKWV